MAIASKPRLAPKNVKEFVSAAPLQNNHVEKDMTLQIINMKVPKHLLGRIDAQAKRRSLDRTKYVLGIMRRVLPKEEQQDVE